MNAVTRNALAELVNRLGGYLYETSNSLHALLPDIRATDHVVTSLYDIAPNAPFDRCGTQITIYS